MKTHDKPDRNTPGKPIPVNSSTTRKNASSPAKTEVMGQNGPHGTPQDLDVSTRAKLNRKIDAGVIAQMAKLVAKMLSETESCRRLGIKPRTWFDWKSRARRNEKFDELLEAFRADRIEQLINRIEKSANGEDLKYPDWRAALALLKITDQKRFGDSPATDANPPASVCVNVMVDAIRRVYAGPAVSESEGKLLAPAQAVRDANLLPPPATVLTPEVKTVPATRIRIPVRRKASQ